MAQRDLVKDATHVGILIVMLVVLLYLLTWTNVMRCRTIPGWCDVYWAVTRGGQPKILIVAGNEGLGDPYLLKDALADPNYIHVLAQVQDISTVNLGNLKNYDLVIVEKARKISTAKLKAFVDYVNGGGRLVWTGDAGTELDTDDQFLYKDERTEDDPHELIGPWARRDGENQVNFDQMISVEYLTNYCMIKRCMSSTPWQGILVTDPERQHPLVYGLKQGLSMRGDFAIVKELGDSISTRVLSLDWQSNIIGTGGTDYSRIVADNNSPSTSGYPDEPNRADYNFYVPSRDYKKIIPIVVTSGYGERVAYYAIPPEQFVAPEQTEKYYSIIENLYIGMLK